MPGVVALVAAISADVVTSLATAGYPPLTDGRILLGRQHQFEQSAPPRILFTPTHSKFGERDVYSRAGTVDPADRSVQNAMKSIGTEFTNFEVRCWGSASPPDPDLDFDFTQALYQQVYRSVQSLAVGSFEANTGFWTDATWKSGQLVRDGREFVFGLTFGTPITERLTPLSYAPSNVAANPQSTMILTLTGESETGCSG